LLLLLHHHLLLHHLLLHHLLLVHLLLLHGRHLLLLLLSIGLLLQLLGCSGWLLSGC
jgi:hypothetical protein